MMFQKNEYMDKYIQPKDAHITFWAEKTRISNEKFLEKREKWI